MPSFVELRWIEIDEDAGVLAMELGPRGVVLLAVRKNRPTDPTMGYWLDEHGKLLGRIEAGKA